MCTAFRTLNDLLLLVFGESCGVRAMAATLLADQRGIETLEWAVIVAIVVVGALATYSILFPALGGFFNTIGGALGTLTVTL